MKERSFTRCTVLAPTPRALAMANIPLPAVIDSGRVFPRWGRSSGARAVCLLAHPRDLHGRRRRGLRQSGWWPGHRAVLPSSPGSKKDASRIIKVWSASSVRQIGGIERSHALTLDRRGDLRDRSRRFGFRSTVPPRYSSSNRAASGNIQRAIQQARRWCYRQHVH